MKEKKSIVFDDGYLDQSEMNTELIARDIRDYISHIDDITRALSVKLDALENENKILREDNQHKDKDISRLKDELLEEKNKSSLAEEERTRLLKSLKEMEEKYERELKKSKLFEVENNRNLDEIKALRKERNELLAQLDKDKASWKDKVKDFFIKG